MSTNSPQSQADSRVVPVLDLHIKLDRVPGNPYRTYDKRREKWGSFSTKEKWLNHPNPHVLPANGDYNGDLIVPATEFEGDLPVIPDVLADEQPENEFECPRCKTELSGYPESCHECNAKFRW